MDSSWHARGLPTQPSGRASPPVSTRNLESSLDRRSRISGVASVDPSSKTTTSAIGCALASTERTQRSIPASSFRAGMSTEIGRDVRPVARPRGHVATFTSVIPSAPHAATAPPASAHSSGLIDAASSSLS